MHLPWPCLSSFNTHTIYCFQLFSCSKICSDFSNLLLATAWLMKESCIDESIQWMQSELAYRCVLYVCSANRTKVNQKVWVHEWHAQRVLHTPGIRSQNLLAKHILFAEFWSSKIYTEPLDFAAGHIAIPCCFGISEAIWHPL